MDEFPNHPKELYVHETIFLVNNGKERRYALIKAEDGIYNTVEVYVNKKAENPLGKVKLGEWSENRTRIYMIFTIHICCKRAIHI